MTREEEIKLFKRFLKEHNVYCRALWLYIHCTHNGEIKANIKNAKDLYKSFMWESPQRWLVNQLLFCTWSATEEGRKLWAKINILWAFTCIENKMCEQRKDKALLEVKYNIQSYASENQYYNWDEGDFIKLAYNKISKMEK